MLYDLLYPYKVWLSSQIPDKSRFTEEVESFDMCLTNKVSVS